MRQNFLAKSFEKHAHYLCAGIMLLPMILLGVASFWKLGRRWLRDDHPMRALVVVFIVLAIAWASQTVEARIVETTFWIRCLVPLIFIFFLIGSIEMFGLEEWVNRAHEPLMIAILISAPIILIASRLRLRTRESKSHKDGARNGSANHG